MFEADGSADAERILAVYQRLEDAARTEFEGLSQEELMDLWVDAEELRSWAMNRRLEAIRELQRRRRAC
jgi:hypothetical protein